MAEEDIDARFAGVREFGWDPKKRDSNLREKKVDFDDAREVFKNYTFIRRSDRHGEIRFQSLCWIISARRAHKSERRKYYHRLPGHAEPGQD